MAVRNRNFSVDDDAAARGAASGNQDVDQEEQEENEEEEEEEDPDRGDEVEEEEEEEGEDDGKPAARGKKGAKDDDDIDDPDFLAEAGDMVPRSRLDEVLERERLLTDHILKTGGKGAAKEEAAPVFDLKAKRREHTKLLLEGKEDDADALADQIDAHILNTATKVAEDRALQRMRDDRAQEEIEVAVTTVNEKYPELNPKNRKAFDKELCDDVVALRDGYIRKGMKPAAAILKASDRLCGERSGGGDEGEGEQVRNRDGKRTTVTRLPPRKPEQVRRSAEIAARVPGRTGAQGVGVREAPSDAEVDPAKMSDDTFDKAAREGRLDRGDKVVVRK